MIEARWFDCLVCELENPIVLETGTDDICDACEIANAYERKEKVLEFESYVLYRDGKEITGEEMIAAFEERYPECN